MRKYKEVLKENVEDYSEFSAYLIAVLEEYENDGNLPAFIKAIRTVVDAQGAVLGYWGIGVFAEKTNLNRQHLYRSSSEKGNPTIRTLHAILHGLGLKLSIHKAS